VNLADLDTAIFRAVNGLRIGPLDALFVVVSTPEFGLGSAALLAAWFLWTKRWRGLGIVLAGVLAVALCDLVGARVIKPLFGRVRPCFALPPDMVRLLVPIGRSNSLPSLHAANNFAAALVASYGDRRAGWLLLPLAALVSLSRVGLGVHWPSDLLAGALWGAICAAVGCGALWLARRARLKVLESSAKAPSPR
jgi:undecaprenyl-diphosphatase